MVETPLYVETKCLGTELGGNQNLFYNRFPFNSSHLSITIRKTICAIYSGLYIDGHESKPANSNFSNFFLFDKFEGNTFLHNVLKNLVPSMSLYPSFRQLSKPAISHRDTFQRNKTG